MPTSNTSQAAAPRILVVDDDAAVRMLLRECFELEGYAVSEASSGVELAACLERERVQLITLDIGLGGENGFDLARQVRTTNNLPIVMITGKGDTIDRVVGLELGADDYITKPFHLREVLARVRAVLRRYEAGGDAGAAADPATSTPVERFVFEGWTLDTARRELKSASGTAQELTTAEYNLLELLVRRPSRVLSRDNIMDLLKGHDWSPYDRTIDSLVVRLRRKIEPEPETPRLIKTVRGVGYVFAADVRRT
jgi:DNA-binding response OmpR family regulator